MKNNNNSKKVRSLLVRGGEALAITSVLLAIVGCSPNKTDTDNSSSRIEMVTECTTPTTTIATSTTTQSTTTNTTTTVVTTESKMMNTQITTTVQENIVQTEPVEYEYESEYEYEYESNNIIIEETESSPVVESYLPITEYERTLLINLVANEAGSNWIGIYDKACVVACVMNRLNSPDFPNTIEGVLTQPYQFSGYYASSYYYSTVTDACIEAVDYYFNNPNEFGSWLYFEGNGTNNYFH